MPKEETATLSDLGYIHKVILIGVAELINLFLLMVIIHVFDNLFLFSVNLTKHTTELHST